MGAQFLLQSKDSGQFVVPHDGYIAFTRSLKTALDIGLLDYDQALSVISDFKNDGFLEMVLIYENF